MPAADVAFSNQFLDRIFSLGTSVRIIGPEEVVEKYAGEIGTLSQMYWGDERQHMKMLWQIVSLVCLHCCLCALNFLQSCMCS